MTSQVVSLQVTASIPIDCDFWSEDDGRKGAVFHGLKASPVKRARKASRSPTTVDVQSTAR
jgi:hypothetical protein